MHALQRASTIVLLCVARAFLVCFACAFCLLRVAHALFFIFTFAFCLLRVLEPKEMARLGVVLQRNVPGQFVTIEQAVEESLQAFTLSLWIRSTRSSSTDAVILSYIAPGSSSTLHAAQFAISDPQALTIFIKG